jgi:hypothetical protein
LFLIRLNGSIWASDRVVVGVAVGALVAAPVLDACVPEVAAAVEVDDAAVDAAPKLNDGADAVAVLVVDAAEDEEGAVPNENPPVVAACPVEADVDVDAAAVSLCTAGTE